MVVDIEVLTRREITGRFFLGNNYPLVCRTVDCYANLGVYHIDAVSKPAIAPSGRASYDSGSGFLSCRTCDQPYDLGRHGVAPTDDFPSLREKTHAGLVKQLKASAKQRDRASD